MRSLPNYGSEQPPPPSMLEQAMAMLSQMGAMSHQDIADQGVQSEGLYRQALAQHLQHQMQHETAMEPGEQALQQAQIGHFNAESEEQKANATHRLAMNQYMSDKEKNLGEQEKAKAYAMRIQTELNPLGRSADAKTRQRIEQIHNEMYPNENFHLPETTQEERIGDLGLDPATTKQMLDIAHRAGQPAQPGMIQSIQNWGTAHAPEMQTMLDAVQKAFGVGDPNKPPSPTNATQALQPFGLRPPQLALPQLGN